jgi:hypothetical protein
LEDLCASEIWISLHAEHLAKIQKVSTQIDLVFFTILERPREPTNGKFTGVVQNVDRTVDALVVNMIF